MELSIGNGIFQGFNDREGIMLCGYEWGWSKADQARNSEFQEPAEGKIEVAFSCKAQHFGPKANAWRYDKNIKKWFELWGHALNSDQADGFEKTIVQTNWCDTQNHHIDGSYERKLLDDEQIRNFIFHVNELKPGLILFFGTKLIACLQNEKVLGKFVDIMGAVAVPLKFVQKDFSGRRFRVGFQDFENCKIISLPHPSSSRGLSDEYIKLFSPEIGAAILEVKQAKNIG